MSLSQTYIRNDDGTAKNVVYSYGKILEVVYSNLTSVAPWDSQGGGNISLNNISLDGIFVDPPILSNNGSYLVLGKGSLHTKGFIIIVIDLENGDLYQSKKTFKLVALEFMNELNVVFHKACHLNDLQNQMSILFNEENFNQIGTIEIAV